jgi:hypothetical protein
MLEKGVIMCAWCKAVQNSYGFVDINPDHIEWLKTQPNISILYTTCDQCRIRLFAENTVIYETHMFNGSEERRCDYG